MAAVLVVVVSSAGCSHKAIPRLVDAGGGTDAVVVADGGADTDAAGQGGEVSDGGDGGDARTPSDASDGSTTACDAGGLLGFIDACANQPPPIDGLVSIEVAPPVLTIALTASGAGLVGTGAFVATGRMSDGHTEDVTGRVTWTSAFESLRITNGAAMVSAPGSYTVRATSGGVAGSATLVATFTGNILAPSFDPASVSPLDGTPVGATRIAYPPDHALLPPNLSPVQVHIARSGTAPSTVRLRFSSDTLQLSYYAACQAGAGAGCYVDLPAEVTRLFIAASETSDVRLTARVVGVGAPLVESPPIQLAWANLPLSGGLYFWTAPGASAPASAALIQRYDFGQPGATRPQLVYTDRGRPPLFSGSPPATADGSTCIGCHAISGDGKTMALTVGGSGAPDIALLDLPTLNLAVLDAPASAGATSTSDINFYKQFRRSGIAAETTFGPRGDVMVSMYRSTLVLRGTTASLMSQGAVAPSWLEYKTDPFWSASGKLFVFTSFVTPDVGMYNPTGLNGDMKRGGQIVIASAGDTQVNDDARPLVAREANLTKYYPAISPDDQLVVYDQSTCGLDPDVYSDPQVGSYGSQTCDGYDDSSASLWLVGPAAGPAPVRLDSLNGGPSNDNSRPQWGPTSGKFRGQPLYWIAFSSRRPYGLQINPEGVPPLGTRPQLWLGAVVIGGALPADPSWAPLWVPNQNPPLSGGVPNLVPTDNHYPQWVRVAVPIPN